jgi:hypothetical protein
LSAFCAVLGGMSQLRCHALRPRVVAALFDPISA